MAQALDIREASLGSILFDLFVARTLTKLRLDIYNNGQMTIIRYPITERSVVASRSSQIRYSKRIRDERKTAGLCTDCGDPKYQNFVRCQTCMQKQKEGRLRYYQKRISLGLCIKCDASSAVGNYCEVHAKEHRRYAKLRHDRLRDEAFAAYGGYKCACPGCNETEKLFLELDHVNGGGNKHRASLNDNSTSVYLWLKNKGYPKGMMQPLCSNCNKGKSRNGGICPHLTSRAPEEDGD